jgi:hypothetical protein
MKEHSKTQPVILLGVDEQEARGFNHIALISEDKNGVYTSEHRLSGVISVQMINDTLVIKVKTCS